jgi:hypothetical protein
VCGVSWQVVGSYGFDVSCLGKPPHTVIGYRALAVDYSENSRFGTFDQVEVGDRVVLLVTRAVAVDIRPV